MWNTILCSADELIKSLAPDDNCTVIVNIDASGHLQYKPIEGLHIAQPNRRAFDLEEGRLGLDEPGREVELVIRTRRKTP
jgi:hypothetical protein